MEKRKRLILEWTEFSLQRFNTNSPTGYPNVDDPQLSIDAFDKHQDSIRQALSRISDILVNIKSSSDYANIRGAMGLEEQDVQKLKILKIIKNNEVTYDVYVAFTISDVEYWGKISDILSRHPKLSSELFKDNNLLQPKEWVVKISGLIIKSIKEWLYIESGNYLLINDYITCYNTVTGEPITLTKDTKIEVVRNFDDKVFFKYNNNTYYIKGDGYVYFNWWFILLE